MIRSIVRSSLRFRLLVLAIAVGVMGVGIAQLRDAPTDTLPEFTPPYVEVQTEALGLSADEVEQLITVPMEADLLNGVEGIDVMRSESLPGLSSITLVFEDDFDLYTGRQLVQERLTQMGAAAMPNISKPPVMLQPYSSSSRLLMFSLESDKVTPIEQSVIARWTLQPRLLGVPGVANVAIWGFRDRQLQVQVDPEKLRDNNVTLKQVVESTANAQISSPLSFVEGAVPGTGGFIETPQQRLGVRHVFDKLTDPKELRKVPVEGTGGKVRLGDVTTVVQDHQPLIGDAVVNDGNGLMLVVEKFPGKNTLEVTRGVEAALEDLKPGLGGMDPDTSVFRPATFIEDAIDNLTLALVIAGILLALVIAAFMFHWRTVLTALFTIPLSLIAAALVLDMLGETFNAISFAGLAVGLAVVIDEAVAGAENVARRLRQHREAGSDRPTADIVRDATSEIRSPLAYAAFISLLAIVPVAVMEGRPGAFFEPLALSYALAVATAMLVALTVTPALSMLLFSRGTGVPRESRLVAAIRPRYDSALSKVAGKTRPIMIGAAALVVVGALAFALQDKSVIPSFKDRDVLVSLDAEPGTSNTRMTEVATQVSRELRSLPGVDNVGAHVGRAVAGDQRQDVNSSDVWVSIDSGADYDKTFASIQDAVAGVQGVRSDVITYSEQKIRDVGALRDGQNLATGEGLDVLTGSDKPLVVRVFGEEFDVLRREANKVRTLMSQTDGVVDPRVEQLTTQPNIEIEVDLDKARAFGVTPGDVRRAEATLVSGLTVGSVFEDQKVFEVVVKGTPDTRRSIADIRNLLLDTPGGGHVRLGRVADVRTADIPISIPRDKVSRYLDVSADVSGRSLDSVAERARRPAPQRHLAARVPRGGADADHELRDQPRARDRRGAGGAGGDLPADAGRRARLDAGSARLRDAAGRPQRGSVCGPDRRGLHPRVARRVPGAARYRSQERADADSPLSGPGALRGRGVRAGAGGARGARAAGPDAHDRCRAGRGRPRLRGHGHSARPRGRAPDGGRDPGRARHHDARQPVRTAGAVPPLRWTSADAVPGGGADASLGRYRAGRRGDGVVGWCRCTSQGWR